jgi:hypothetical protein
MRCDAKGNPAKQVGAIVEAKKNAESTDKSGRNHALSPGSIWFPGEGKFLDQREVNLVGATQESHGCPDHILVE